jgi:signal transduction histidine kinase
MPLFRVVQEAMTNIYRHSGADHAWVTLHREERMVSLEVRDNGRGFDEGVVVTGESADGGQPLERRLGVGLQGMRERLANIGGKFDIESTPLGVTISIRLTLDASYVGSAH